MRGAIREDDGGKIFGFGIGKDGEPYDDPYGNFNRWCNHFFDPTKSVNRAATFFCFLDTRTDAANWALGTSDAFASPSVAMPTRRNHFTAVDAREALYRAVTGKKKDGSGAGSGGSDADFKTRKSYYATLFRALGDVLHLNQDMAQPQHTRNESHAGVGGAFNIGGNPAYELRIDTRAAGLGQRQADGNVAAPPALTYVGYAIPRFNRLSDFWSSAPGQPIPNGKGLADYSSRGFFTPANNYGGTNYVSPASTTDKYTSESKTFTILGASNQSVTVKYLRGVVSDNQNDSSVYLLITKESAWKDLVSVNQSLPTYTQDNAIFDDMASQLIPRAVGYSAGILDYFFRGKMQIDVPEAGGAYAVADHSKITINDDEVLTNFKGFGKIKLKLSVPDTGNDGQPQSFGGGKLLGVVKFRRNTCFDKDLTKFVDLDQSGSGGKPKFESCRSADEELVVSDPVDGGAVVTLNATPKPVTLNFAREFPLNATDVRLHMVYRGKLGAEDDEVVVATQDLSEPTYFSYINASDYSTIQTDAGVKVYTRDEINASQALLQKVYPQSCVDKNIWQLKPGCLESFDIRLGLKIGTTTIDVQALPVRRFMRIAYLGNADTTVSLSQIAENTCYPHSPFNVETLEWQSSPDASNNPTAAYPEFQKIRGVWGWYGSSCVNNGDGLAPGSVPDNRNQVMADLPESGKVPVEAIVNDGASPM
jgi:hypothetical protein